MGRHKKHNKTAPPEHTARGETLDFQLMMSELMDKMQDASLLEKLVAPSGNACFYCNEKGDLCLLTQN